MSEEQSDVLIIGAGPAGAVAAALLVQRGVKVTVLERQAFPRFSIGESLLAHCLDILEEAGLLGAEARAMHEDLCSRVAFIERDRALEPELRALCADIRAMRWSLYG